MNNLITLASLIGGRRNRRFINMFRKRRSNNRSVIMLSLLGLTTLGVIGSRNKKWVHQIQEGYYNLQDNMSNPFPNPNQVNYVSEFAEEITPETFDKINDYQ